MGCRLVHRTGPVVHWTELLESTFTSTWATGAPDQSDGALDQRQQLVSTVIWSSDRVGGAPDIYTCREFVVHRTSTRASFKVLFAIQIATLRQNYSAHLWLSYLYRFRLRDSL